MATTAPHPEFEIDPLTRRHLLGGGAAFAAMSALGPTARTAAASRPTNRTGRLVTVFLRGGMDHLSAVAPIDDADLRAARPTIAMSGGLALDDRFALHPAMPRLHERFLAGTAVPIVATGNPAGDRSHFVAQDLVAIGAEKYLPDTRGWLARHLLDTPHDPASDTAVLRALTVGANVDRSLAGFPAVGMASIQQFGLGSGADEAALVKILRRTHGGDSTADQVGRQALTVAGAIGGLPASTADDETRRTFADVATILDDGRDAGLGTEVVTVDIGGWDTHNTMGTTEAGEMRTLLAGLDTALGDFQDDLDARGIDDVRTVVLTEFGRRVEENGSGGTDHGWGSVMFVLGSGLVGATVHGDWRGLAPEVLGERGDVPATTDFRDVLAEVAGATIGVDAVAAFPGHDASAVGVVAPP
ncbi:MAG: DUF1501 domain-containing protein [Acidimicrobiales bacterium]